MQSETFLEKASEIERMVKDARKEERENIVRDLEAAHLPIAAWIVKTGGNYE